MNSRNRLHWVSSHFFLLHLDYLMPRLKNKLIHTTAYTRYPCSRFKMRSHCFYPLPLPQEVEPSLLPGSTAHPAAPRQSCLCQSGLRLGLPSSISVSLAGLCCEGKRWSQLVLMSVFIAQIFNTHPHLQKGKRDHLYWALKRCPSLCKLPFMLSHCILTSIQCNGDYNHPHFRDTHFWDSEKLSLWSHS